MGWNGTEIKSSWLRSKKYGVRDNSLPHWARTFFCDGCNKEHGKLITRYKTLDGRMLCIRQFVKEPATVL